MRRGFLTLVVALLACTCVRADVGVVLNESLDTSIARITGSGHSAVYLSRVCPASPVKLRLCRPGEQGSVISNYTTLGEDQSFEWNIAPLNVYLYGLPNSEDRPLFSTAKIKALLEERYREESLDAYCPGPPCTTSKKAEWREMVAATSSRSIYIFVVATTVEQDRQLIAKFNAQPNKNHFNAFTRNCANFTRGIVNMYFPHATRPDYVNDFGMTSPKAIARSFAHYARRHPGSEYRVLHFAQLPGTIKRSTVARDGTEQLYRSKKLLVPMIFLAGHELPVFAASYILTGRFDPQRELEQHPTVRATGIDYQLKLAKSDDDQVLEQNLEAEKGDEQSATVGTPEAWARYRQDFDGIVNEAIREEIIPDRDYLNTVFKNLDEAGRPFVNSQGVWLEITESGKRSVVGLSPRNIEQPGSNPGLAYRILLAHINHVLKSPAHSREAMPRFLEAWSLLQAAHSRRPATVSLQAALQPTSPRR